MQQDLQTNRNCNWIQGMFRIAIVAALVNGSILTRVDLAVGQDAVANAKPAYQESKLGVGLDVEENVKKLRGIKDESLKGATAYNKQEVDRFYREYLIPKLNRVSQPEEVSRARIEIYSDLEKAEKASEAVLGEFNKMLMLEMKQLAEGNFHPSAAIIATQVLGQLNKKKTKSTTAAEPFDVQTTSTLFGLYRNGKNDGIRAAALAGLERHIELMNGKWDANVTEGIAKAFMASLTSPKPVTRSERADAWLRGRAIELLLKFKHSKEAELYKYAMTTLADPKTDPLLFEKALLVAGAYPSAGVDASVTTPAISNALSYLVNMSKEWKKRLGDAQYLATSEASGDGEGRSPMNVNESGANDPGGDDLPGKKKKAAPKKEAKVMHFDKQSEDVKSKRRALHELLEIARVGLVGSDSKFGPLPTELKIGFASLIPEGEDRMLMMDILNAIKDLQSALNSPSISDRTTLGSETIPKLDALIQTSEIMISVLASPAEAAAGEQVKTP